MDSLSLLMSSSDLRINDMFLGGQKERVISYTESENVFLRTKVCPETAHRFHILNSLQITFIYISLSARRFGYLSHSGSSRRIQPFPFQSYSTLLFFLPFWNVFLFKSAVYIYFFLSIDYMSMVKIIFSTSVKK